MPISIEEYEARIGRPARVTSAAPTSQREYGWGDRLGASVDRFQCQVQGTMEELGFDTGDARRQNEANRRFARQRAIEETGAPQSFGETFESPTKFARGVGGLFVDSAPELALSLGTGLVGGLAGVGRMGRLGMEQQRTTPPRWVTFWATSGTRRDARMQVRPLRWVCRMWQRTCWVWTRRWPAAE